MILPCYHDERVVAQVQPAIDLLARLDEQHPEVLLEHNILPDDYHGSMVFRSAVESLRGSFVASSTVQREGVVGRVLQSLRQSGQIADFAQNSSRERFDFTVAITRDPDYFAAIEVKGGEGNSINISDRPLFAREFGVWCHLDGAIVNQPAHGAHSIINRLASELVKRHKRVDTLFFKDALCGTRLRLCPKYGHNAQDNARIAPDVFLFPLRVPTHDDPQPPLHQISSLRLPELILKAFDVPVEEYGHHIWQVGIKIVPMDHDRSCHEVEVWHQGVVVDRSRSCPWQVLR